MMRWLDHSLTTTYKSQLYIQLLRKVAVTLIGDPSYNSYIKLVAIHWFIYKLWSDLNYHQEWVIMVK